MFLTTEQIDEIKEHQKLSAKGLALPSQLVEDIELLLAEVNTVHAAAELAIDAGRQAERAACIAIVKQVLTDTIPVLSLFSTKVVTDAMFKIEKQIEERGKAND